MAGISNREVFEKRTSFVEYIKSRVDPDGYMTLRTSAVAADLGLDSMCVQRYLKHFAGSGRVEFEREQKGVYIVKYNGNTQPASDNLVYVPLSEFRKCPKCGAEACNTKSRFCWRCGSSLLSEKEQVKEEYHNILGFICRVVKNPMDIKKIMEVLSKVEKIAFGDEKGE
jgi:hypothetical protein